MKRVIIVFAFLMWGATLCVWYVIHQEKNRYIATNGFVLDLEKQRYIKVGKKHWYQLMETADEQLERFGNVVFEDNDYKFLKNACRLSEGEWDYAVSTKGSGREIFEGIKARRKYHYAEGDAYDEILSMGISSEYIYDFRLIVEVLGDSSWQSILSALNQGGEAQDVLDHLKNELRKDQELSKIFGQTSEERTKVLNEVLRPKGKN